LIETIEEQKIFSPSFQLKYGKNERTFQLFVQINKENSEVGMFLENLSPVEVNVLEAEMKVIDKNGFDFVKLKIEEHKLTPRYPRRGFTKLFLLADLNTHDLLHNRSLKLACDLTICDDETAIEGYYGIGLKESLENLRKDHVLSDFKIICNGEEFACHKAILAARYLKVLL
jgi:hypothetical protein